MAGQAVGSRPSALRHPRREHPWATRILKMSPTVQSFADLDLVGLALGCSSILLAYPVTFVKSSILVVDRK